VTRRRGIARAAIAVALLAFAWALFQPLAGDGKDEVRVVIPKQEGLAGIADILDSEGVVKSGALFELRATLAGKRGDLKPGTYTLRKGMSYGDVLDRLAGGPGSEVVTVTIPEGLSRAEAAPIVRKAGIDGDYARASESSSSFRPRSYGAEGRPQSLEGFLFPATYELRRGSSSADLVEKQLAAFEQNISAVDTSYAKGKNLTVFDIVTIASMVERETSLARERPLIAAVIYNRLREGQPLGIDATVRFATGNWTRPLTKSELAGNSPYNTRNRAGLPPGPIGSPGLASLKAAARPAKVGYLYYVVKPGACGEHAFSSNFAQFERDRVRYQAAREAAGGNSPTGCP
jgi:peptidoglycan lytic transglycosylase G